MSTSTSLFTARILVDELVRGGVRTVCVAPGSRSTSLALAVAEREDLRTHVLTDERSMAFFALGIARAGAGPVAVVCTSGTAAANLLPAAVESALGGGSLVLLTADRPPELRDCAAPQTIDQTGLFGSHARWAVDVPILDATPDAERVLRSLASRAIAVAREDDGGPVHMNVPLREPFVDASFPSMRCELAARGGDRPFTEVRGAPGLSAADARELAARLGRAERGVIVCAGRETPADAVSALARALGWPVLADPLSGLRFGDHDRSHVADGIEPLLRDEALRESLRPDAIVRFGLTPPSRSVQRWLEEAWPAEHVVVAARAWPDPVRGASTIVRAEPGQFCRMLAAACGSPASHAGAWRARWLSMSALARRSMETALDGEDTLFDGVVLRALERTLPAGATLVVGNSMPVRDADAFLASSGKKLRVLANRGASGIDGVVSTALGIASVSRGPAALVVGDLSFLHDSAVLAFAARERIPLLIVVVNNDGGGIFSYLPLHAALSGRERGTETFERFFGTPHGASPARIADACGIFALSTHTRSALDDALAQALDASLAGPSVLEVRTDREAGRRAQLAIVHAAQDAVAAGESVSRRIA